MMLPSVSTQSTTLLGYDISKAVIMYFNICTPATQKQNRAQKYWEAKTYIYENPSEKMIY